LVCGVALLVGAGGCTRERAWLIGFCSPSAELHADKRMVRFTELMQHTQLILSMPRATDALPPDQEAEVRTALREASVLANGLEEDYSVSLLRRFDLLNWQLQIRDFSGARDSVVAANWTADAKKQWLETVKTAEAQARVPVAKLASQPL
jgi:hypothetical protein